MQCIYMNMQHPLNMKHARISALLSLTAASYTISEGEVLSVCILLTGVLTSSVVGNIVAQDGTAIGKKLVYIQISVFCVDAFKCS